MKHNIVLIFFAYTLNLFCQFSSISANPIIGGFEDRADQHKYLVSVRRGSQLRKIGRGHFCGGTIVHENHILSAGHCYMTIENGNVNWLVNIQTDNVIVVAGMNFFYGPGIVKEVAQIFIPLTYESHGVIFGDIAVLKLRENLHLVAHATRLRALTMDTLPGNDNYVNQEATFCGFGQIHEHRVRVPFSNIRVCLNVLIHGSEGCQLFDWNICAATADRTTTRTSCHGDGGAGLVLGNAVLGVLSHGPPHCDTNDIPIYFTRVSKFGAFLEAAMDEQGDHRNMHVLGRPDQPEPSAVHSAQSSTGP